MNVLFVMRHSGYVRNFESTLRLLCERGHRVHLAFQNSAPHQLLDPSDTPQRLCDAYPRFSRGAIPVRDDGWAYVARELRAGLDYLRYLRPEYANAPKLVARSEREAPASLVRWLRRAPLATGLGRAAAAAGLRSSHEVIPTDPRIDAYLAANRPDVLALTPLIEPGSPQAEYVRSARALGIRTALCVASWDNLTSKGLIHGSVDLVTVWNHAMKREAVTLHGVPESRVVVTGAQPFDHWFDWAASGSRDAFCAKVGLPVDQPYVLYMGSSRFIAPDEVPFVRRWLEALRQSPTLHRVGVLIRPHPQNARQWAGADLQALGPVAVYPPHGATPSDDASRQDYFDSMYHSVGVVGVNTTAEIESAIVGRPVLTVLAPEFKETQEGTLHFDHLKGANGGLLRVAGDLSEHVAQLVDVVDGRPGVDDRCRRFVEGFVRPHGLSTAATPLLVEALERLAAQPVHPTSARRGLARAARPFLLARGERLRGEALAAYEVKAARHAKKARLAEVEAVERKAAERKAAEQRRGASADDVVGVGGPPGTAAALASAQSAVVARTKDAKPWRLVVNQFRALADVDRWRFAKAAGTLLPRDIAEDGVHAERLDYPEAEILLRVTTAAERTRLRSCAKEPFTVEWIHRCVGRGDVLFDIGANVGAYSLVAALRPSGGARVYAFEPSYANVAALSANIVLNKVADAVTPMPVALSNNDAMTVFGLRALEAGSARHTLGDASSDEGPILYRQPVLMLRLDSLVERFGLPQPNHIKLDVDGGELAVLEGATRALASPALRSMLVEVGTELSSRITEILERHGLRLDSKVNVQNKAGEYRVWYGLFTRDARHGAGERDVQVQFVDR